MVSFPQDSSSKPCIQLSSPPYVLPAPPISFFNSPCCSMIILTCIHTQIHYTHTREILNNVVIILDLLEAMEFEEKNWACVCMCVRACVRACVRGHSGFARWTGVNLCRYGWKRGVNIGPLLYYFTSG